MSTPQLAIHLSYDGNCAEAFAFYAKVLGGKIGMMMPYSASPMAASVPAAEAGRLMHASMELGNMHLLGADAVSNHPFGGSAGFSISLSYPTVEEAQAIYDALSEGGMPTMPFAATFWAPGFGMLTDRFGISWMVSCEHSGAAS